MVKGSDAGKTAPGKAKPRKDRARSDERAQPPAAAKGAAKRASPDHSNESATQPDKSTDPKAQRRAERQAERAAVKLKHQAQRQAERDARRAARQSHKAVAVPVSPAFDGTGDDAEPARPRKAVTAPHPAAVPAPDTAQASSSRPATRAPAPPRPGKKRAAPAAATTRPGASQPAQARDFDILVVAQGGGIDRDAAMLAASLRRNAPGFAGRLIVAEPQPTEAWAGADPRMSLAARAALTSFGADIRPLTARDFGRRYPHGNKIEALALLDPARPFLFLDSDTLITGDISAVPFDFARPAASMRRSGTWPQPPAYRETYDSIWRSLYDRFGLDMDATLDASQPVEHWERFLYFNAGWFFGDDPATFYRRFRDWAVAVRDDPGEALACQSLDPWLDQVILPLVIHSLGGGRPGPELEGLDGDVTCHWRNLPLLYAREPDRVVDEIEAIAALPQIAPLIQGWGAGQRLIRDGLGRRRIRPMFAAEMPRPPEQALRHRLRQADLWIV